MDKRDYSIRSIKKETLRNYKISRVKLMSNNKMKLIYVVAKLSFTVGNKVSGNQFGFIHGRSKNRCYFLN